MYGELFSPSPLPPRERERVWGEHSNLPTRAVTSTNLLAKHGTNVSEIIDSLAISGFSRK
jgi:hypothetical protein